ncbi:mannose-1-phosphate guanyltransferase [Halobacteriales archaeon QS_1_68_20]|nr:MAG: mannose-1-phosphate guanyltransferase [Halobacteriales archaeon QS_1_68_20]
MDRPIVALVMAGGTGTRLYPASSADRPKQFLSFGGERSLLARTVDRCSFADEVLVSTTEDLLDGVRERAPDADVLVEPVPKDTGPALTYATFWCRELLGDCVVLAVPNDHVIGDGFADTARRAAKVAVRTRDLVTFGVDPDRPATEYGYVEPGAEREDHYAVEAFHEKPDRETAADRVDAGWYWNAGIFAWTPDAFLSAAADSALAPMLDALEADDPARGFREVEAVSVDYAVLERTAGRDDGPGVVLVPADFDWDDLGSWDALARVLDADADGNVALGEGLTLDAADNVIASDGTHVSVVGAEDLVVAAFGDRVLVVPKDEAQRVREVVAELRQEGRF